MNKKLGYFLIVIGAISGAVGFLIIMGSSVFLFNSDSNFGLGVGGAMIGFLFSAAGLISIFSGIIIISYFSSGKTSTYMAKKTAKATKISTEAFGEGLARGIKKGLRKK